MGLPQVKKLLDEKENISKVQRQPTNGKDYLQTVCLQLNCKTRTKVSNGTKHWTDAVNRGQCPRGTNNQGNANKNHKRYITSFLLQRPSSKTPETTNLRMDVERQKPCALLVGLQSGTIQVYNPSIKWERQ